MAVLNPVSPISGNTMVSVAASQTGVSLGAAGAKGDFVGRVLIKPASTSPGAVTLIDGSTSYVLFPGGTTADVTPIPIEVGACSNSGAWTITTGTNVSVIVFGNFT